MTTATMLLANGFSRIPALVRNAVADLDPTQLSARPVDGANSLAWLAWHTARGQDSWVSDLHGSEQAWTTEGWFENFDLPFGREENGFAMPEAETVRVSSTSALINDYLGVVTARTLAYLDTLTESDLDDIVDTTRRPVVSRGVQLVSILDDGLQHAGQAGYARGILDRSSRHLASSPSSATRSLTATGHFFPKEGA